MTTTYKKPFLKDKKIIIYQKKNAAEPGDMPQEILVPIHSGKLWAYFLQMGGDVYYTAKQTGAKEDVMFQVNWRADIVPDMMVFYNGRFYQITRVDRYEGYKSDLKLYCSAEIDSTVTNYPVLEYGK